MSPINLVASNYILFPIIQSKPDVYFPVEYAFPENTLYVGETSPKTWHGEHEMRPAYRSHPDTHST